MSRCITKLIKQQNIMNKQKKQQKEKENNGLYTLLPTVFDTVEQAVEMLKLDRRHKWEEFCGELVYPYKYSHACSGCTEQKEMQASPQKGCGCDECGYTGRRRDVVPVPAFMPDGSIVKVKPALNGG